MGWVGTEVDEVEWMYRVSGKDQSAGDRSTAG